MEKGFGTWPSYQLSGCGLPNLNTLYKPLSPGHQQNLTLHMNCCSKAYNSKFPGSCENPKESWPPVPPSECFQKRFLVFDQIGNRGTLVTPEFNNSHSRRTCLLGAILTDDERVMDPIDDSENSDNHEDTEEIDALLYSDDEEASTGRSPSFMTIDGEQEQLEEGEEEVVSSAGSTKKIKLSDVLPVPKDTVRIGNCKRNFDHEDDTESSFSHCKNLELVEFSSTSLSGHKRLRRNERIRETVSILQGLIPSGQSKNAIMVLDEAISYLKSMKHEAKGMVFLGSYLAMHLCLFNPTINQEMNLLRDVEHTPMSRSFFKVYLRSRSSNFLQFPPAFVAEVREVVPNKAFLKSPAGKCWVVEVETMGEDMFFVNGWAKFVSDNSIEDGHFLVFDYNGEMTFNFRHYDDSSCEVLEEVRLNDIGLTSSKKKRHASSPYSASDEDIFKYGSVKIPENPFFVTRLRRKKKNALFVPGDVMRDNHIHLPSTVMILDEKGRQILTKVLTWNDGRTWIIDGWKLFVRNNHVTEDDRCICEFVVDHGDYSDVFLKMTVLRAGSWYP